MLTPESTAKAVDRHQEKPKRGEEGILYISMQKNAGAADPRPLVGVGVTVLNEQGQILLSLRKGAHGVGEWAFPGGHLEFGETIFETAKREVREETDLHVDHFELISVNDELRYIATGRKHYVGIGVLAKYQGGEPKVMEPHKSVEWRWFDLNQLPEPLFQGTHLTIQNYKDRRIYQPGQ